MKEEEKNCGYFSQHVYGKGLRNIATRECAHAIGFSEFELENRPIIGIANSWNNIVPGHANLRELADHVRNGIYANGGTAVEFGVIAGCDGVAIYRESMNYTLPSRDIICDSIELQVKMSMLDGIVLMGSCDKIVPGMLMAAARLNIPAIMVNGGPMLGGVEFDGRKSDQTTSDEAYGMFLDRRVAEDIVAHLEYVTCPGAGSCAYLGTANSMCCMAEALGMSLPGSALIPAVYARRKQSAFDAGRKICELVRKDIRPIDIMTVSAVNNAVAVASTISASTNVVIHLAALVHELGLEADVSEMFRQAYYKIPQLAKVNPASRYNMEDFYQAGGIPRVMMNLGKFINRQALTVTAHSVGQNLTDFRFDYPENENVIRTYDAPFDLHGGIQILEGNLAPDGAVSKPGAIDPACRFFRGIARVFDSEEEANNAIIHGKIREGDVLVIRYEGPKGGPGMREMYFALKYLYGKGLGTKTALVTDGRFSGTNNGCFVGHISPEAAEGGPIAIVEDGDVIEIDVDNGNLVLDVSEEEIADRFAKWTGPKIKETAGYLKRYAQQVTSANKGAVLNG